ncbi:phytoene/squalene synthase family protein [Jiella sonneratiae]|uniref:Phytoene/squalene synthase family protein n=1 Tax=Jiella sonneratiae TaxID=2816856 RepID=A0ABS3J7I3_9HYPH|nr:phytoene/squalene synthase family protein [Jiella sonneratiae]MBO0905630.1 phytoene/squalene synthase family protein [Jiella sonneratiae]
MAASDPDACRNIVETGDPDRALSLAFAPPAARADLAALYAFNVEVARVRDQVSQPLPGEIRLQWWRDAIAATAPGTAGEPSPNTGTGTGTETGGPGEVPGGGAAGHPVASRLIEAIARHRLPGAAFDRMLEARIFDLYDDPMPTRQDFEAYAGETASTLIVLAATIVSRDAADAIADAAGHAGVAQTAAGVLRLLPIHRARRQAYVPADILAAAGCTAEQLIAGEEAPSLRAVGAMLAFGREHAGVARRHLEALPKDLRSVFLPALLATPYFDRIERAGASVLHTAPDLSAPRKVFSFWRAMRR